MRQVVGRRSGASLGAAGRLPAVGGHCTARKELIKFDIVCTKKQSVYKRFRLPAPRWLGARHTSGAQV